MCRNCIDKVEQARVSVGFVCVSVRVSVHLCVCVCSQRSVSSSELKRGFQLNSDAVGNKQVRLGNEETFNEFMHQIDVGLSSRSNVQTFKRSHSNATSLDRSDHVLTLPLAAPCCLIRTLSLCDIFVRPFHFRSFCFLLQNIWNDRPHGQVSGGGG